MKAKTMKLSYILPLLMLGGTTLFTGCEQGKDLYDPELVQEMAKKVFPVKDIDPNHTWETSALCNATVSINEKAGDTYTIKVYTANPYNTNGNAALLATTTVTDGKTANFKFDIPATLQQVYVMKVNEAGYSAAVPATVENGILKVDFGGKNATTTRTVMTRSSEENFFQPETFGEEYFPTKAPGDCGNVSGYGETTNTIPYLLKDETINELKFSVGGVLYIEGNVTINSWVNPGGDNAMKIYLLPNAILNMNSDFFINQVTLSIGEGATLNMNNKTLAGVKSGAKILNKGIIRDAGTIKLSEAAYLHNEGEVITNIMKANNGACYIYNAPGGKMTIDEDLKISGGGHFLNDVDGEVIVGNDSDNDDDDDGCTVIDCNDGSWENRGHFITDEMKISTQNNSIKNACWLEVNDDLEIGHNVVVINENYIVCEDLEMKNGTVIMGGGSFFEVTSEAEFSWHEIDSHGFMNSTDQWALLKMGKAVRDNNGRMGYSGKLYIACNDHFTQGNIYYQNYKLSNGAELSNIDGADIHIKNSKCNPGYGGTPDGGGSGDKVATYAYGFEDMTKNAGDYDFNDVVLYVSVPYEKEDVKYVDVTLKAAGASKALSVKFNNEADKTTNVIFENVHAAMGVPAGTLANTGRATGTEVTKSIKVSENFDLTTHGDFYIIEGTREIHIPAFTDDFINGNAPYAIRVANTNWKWPKEQISIENAYQGFTNWAQNALTETNWYETPVEGKVMTNN